MDLCRTSHFLNTKGVGPAAGKATLVREAERNGFVNDYFFIAPSRTADTWAAATEHPLTALHLPIALHTLIAPH